jgi:hypothetical protein
VVCDRKRAIPATELADSTTVSRWHRMLSGPPATLAAHPLYDQLIEGNIVIRLFRFSAVATLLIVTLQTKIGRSQVANVCFLGRSRMKILVPTLLVSSIIALDRSASMLAQEATLPEPVTFTTQEDHQQMLHQLGITKLRPGRNANPEGANPANYDEAMANPYPDWPEILKREDGTPVTTAEGWWEQRRPEIVELFEREVYGRVPERVPRVTWNVQEVRDAMAGDVPTTVQHLVGTVDNSACPEIQVEISMSLTLPQKTARPVPVLMMFGPTEFDPLPEWMQRFRNRRPADSGGPRPPSRADELIAAGWGCVLINPNTIQADQGAGLTRGIIGLTNLGQPRKPDDWGALRAWAWGASRGLDYLRTDPRVDAKRVGIEGVSRYGKAALVAMAFDQRFAMALVGSSGAGGATPHRRNFGEAVENLTGSGEYHWMAGNFLKYGADESSFGSKTANDLPVDSHQLIALCAPRLTFISYGIPEKGDAHWLDQRGSFMATVAADPLFRRLGSAGLGTTDDFQDAQLPPVNEGLLNGTLAWRQHDGGHTDAPNLKYFIEWAERHFAAR